MSSSVPDELVDAIAQARAAPDDEVVWDAVDELARSTQRPEEVSKLYREVLDQQLPPDVLEKLGERAVAFHEEWFEDPSHVIGVLQRVLAVDPGAEWAFERLSLMLTMAERWDELLDQYDRALEATDDSEQEKKLLDEAARIAKDFAGQTNRAIDYLKRLIPLRPEDGALAQSLERRLVLQKRFRDLIDVWNARLGVMDAREALATRVRIAETWLDKLDDAENALSTAEAVVESDNGQEPACGLLERIATRSEAPRETRRSALDRLRSVYESEDRSEDVVRTIGLVLDIVESDEERIELRREARDRLTALERYEDAVEHGAELLILSAQADVRDRLRELVEKTGQHARFVEALVGAAKSTDDGECRVEFTIEAGHVCEDTLQSPPRAIELYTTVLTDGAASDAAQLDVCRRLTGLLAGDEHARQRLEVLERLSTLEPDKADRRRVLGEAARVAEGLGDLDGALGFWKRRLKLDKADAEALDAAVEILERAERWEELVKMLRRRAKVSEPDFRRADLVRVAGVYRAQLGNIEKAINVWEEIQEEFGSNTETIDALANLSAEARRWTDVVGLLRTAADSEEDQERRANQLARMGNVYREQRNAPLKAVESYREAIDIDPRHEGAREGLRMLLDGSEAARQAIETLALAYNRSDEYDGILGLVEQRIQLAENDELRKAVLLEAAGIRERESQDLEGALAYVRRAFALVWSREIEAELVRLAEQTGNFELAAAGYKDAVLACTEPERERELLFEQGRILETRLDRPEGALEAYLGITDTEPSNVPAVCAVVRVGGGVGRWDAVARVLVDSARACARVEPDVVSSIESIAEGTEGWAPATDAIGEAIDRADALEANLTHDLLEQLALWHRDRRQDLARAETALKKAVTHQKNADTLTMLAELQRRAPGRDLVDTLLLLADATGDDLEVLHEACDVALTRAQDPELATPILDRLLEVASRRWKESEPRGDGEPSTEERFSLWALGELVRLRLEAGRQEQAAQLLVEGAKLPFAPEKSRQLRFQAAEIIAKELGDTPGAVELLSGILDEAPDDAQAIGLLASLYSSEGRPADLLELRRRELALDPPVDRRLELRLDIARVIGELGESSDERIRALRDNLADEPGHEASVDALAEVLEAESRHEELLDVFTEQAQKVQELGQGQRAASLWAMAGHLAEEPIGDVQRALDRYRRSVELEPSLGVLDALARIHTARGEHSQAVHWLKERLVRTGRDSDDLAAYRDTVLRLARAERAADLEDDARKSVTDALREDPAAGKLREFLAEMYRQSEDWELLAPLLAEGVEYAKDDGQKIQLLTQAAQVHRRRLNQTDRAIPLLTQAVELAPKDRGTRLALSDSLRAAGRHAEAREILEGLLEEFGRRRTKERAAVHFHLARIARAEGKLDEAHTQLESASSIQRTDPQILKLLGDVAREKGQPEQAERAYRALLLIVRRQAPSEPDVESDEEVTAASEVMYDLYQLALEQGQSDRANDLLESAFETAAENNFEALRFERLLRERGQTDLVLRVLDSRLDRIDDPAAAADILVARADLLAETDRLEEALDSLLEALGRTPDSTALLKSARELAERAGALDRYIERLSDVARAQVEQKPRVACNLWLRLGGLAEKELGDTEKAIEFFQQALSTGRRALTAYQSLLRLLPEDDTARRTDALRRFADAPQEEGADPSVRTGALYRLAEAELSDPSTAESGAARLEEAMDRDLRLDAAREMLRNAVALVPDNERVVRLYERIARQIGGDELMLDALSRSAMLPGASFDLVRDALVLARERGDEQRLSSILERAVELARQSGSLGEVTWALTDLAARREAAGDVAGAVELLAEASRASEGGESFELDLKVAELAAGPLGNPKLAAETYEKLLEAEPTESRAWKPLLEVYRSLGEREKLEACIAKTVEAVYDPVERNTLRMERGRILLEDPERIEEAEQILREVLDEDPDHVQASVVLAELLEKGGRTEELNELLQKQLDGARDRGDAEAIATITLRIGQTVQSKEDAIALYKEALEQAPESRELLDALLGLYGPDDDPHDRAAVMEKLLAVEEGEAAAKLAFELAEVQRSLGNEDAVGRILARGFASCPTHPDLRDQLFGWYSERERWDELADALLLDAEQRQDAAEAVAQYKEAAALFTDRLGNLQGAAAALEAALERTPHDAELLSELVTLHASSGSPERALEAVTNAIESEGGAPADRARLLALRGTLKAQQPRANLEVLADALSDLEQARSVVESGFEQELVDLLDRQREQAQTEGDEDLERAATMRLAELLPKIGDQRRGLELLVSWVKRKPDDAGAVRGLGQFAVAAEKWGAAAKAYQRLVDITEGQDQVDAAIRLAEACEKAETPMDARPALEAVYQKAPGDEMIRTRLRRMYEAAEAYEELASIMIAEAEQATDDDTKLERLLEAGDLSLRVAGGEGTAINAFRQAHELNPDDHRAVIKLADAMAHMGEIEDAAALLDSAINAHGKKRSPELSELQHGMARVGRIAEDYEAVFAWLEAAVQTDRQNGAAAAELAVVAMEQGELETAIKALQAITLLKTPGPMSRAEAYLRQGMIAEQKGDRRKAIFLAKRALTTEPEYEDAKNFLEQVGGS